MTNTDLRRLLERARDQHARDVEMAADLVEDVTGERPVYRDGGLEVSREACDRLREWMAGQATYPSNARVDTAFGIPLRLKENQ